MLFPKFRYWRSEGYRRWVASRPCIACGIEGYSQCAHSNQAKHGKGGAKKASDEFSFPLCSSHGWHQGCHTMHDLCIDMDKNERDALEDRYIAETWDAAEAAGWHDKRQAA